MNAKHMAEALAKHGRHGDTILAHITPKEAMMLHKSTDGASVNPKTGLLEFWDSDPGGANSQGMDGATGVDGTSTGEDSQGSDGGAGYGGIYDISPQSQAANPANAPSGQTQMSQNNMGGYDYAGAPVSMGAKAATGFFNFVNPFGLSVRPSADPRSAQKSYATFSPFGLGGGLLGLAAGVPGLGKLGSMMGPQYSMNATPPNQGAPSDHGEQWRVQQQARALMG